MLAQCWKLNINKFGHGHITLKCAFYSTFNFFIYVQINKWLINREKICVLNGNTDSKILLNPCKETFLYKHFCGNFSDISFKVNISTMCSIGTLNLHPDNSQILNFPSKAQKRLD